MPIPCNHSIDLIKQPRHSRCLPGPGWPASRPTAGESERNGAGAADLRAIIGNDPRCRLGFDRRNPGAINDAKLLRRNDLESLLVGEAPDPPGATRAEASIPVKNERGANRSPIRELAEVHEAN
jgi:hypothetical protein